MYKTKEELVAFAKSKVGTPYVYGAKGEVLTQAMINTWAKAYPSTYTSTYINKAKKFIGKRCTDCSGLISWCTGILRGSSNFKETATVCVPISQLNESHIGWALWRQGHIGVYIGNGKVVEARGIDYGTVISDVSRRNFTHVIKLRDIDYGAKATAPKKDGWIKENGKWHVYQNGKLFTNDWFKSTAGYWYCFDQDGNLRTGWIQSADGNDWYYCDPDMNDDLIGKMLTNTIIRSAGKNYILDKDGKMIKPGNKVTLTIGESGVVSM